MIILTDIPSLSVSSQGPVTKPELHISVENKDQNMLGWSKSLC